MAEECQRRGIDGGDFCAAAMRYLIKWDMYDKTHVATEAMHALDVFMQAQPRSGQPAVDALDVLIEAAIAARRALESREAKDE